MSEDGSSLCTDGIDRLFPRCQFCKKRSAVWGGKRCPFCWRHPDYSYDQPVRPDIRGGQSDE